VKTAHLYFAPLRIACLWPPAQIHVVQKPVEVSHANSVRASWIVKGKKLGEHLRVLYQLH
jgi:hypothetical protein